MLEKAHIGLKVDVDTLRGTREGVPRLVALLKKHGVDATFYFSVGPDHTGRALRRVFRPGFFQKVARTSVVKHYGLKTLLYGVLLPGPDIGRAAGDVMRGVHEAGFEVGLHTYDHVRWQDSVATASPEWTRVEFERGLKAFERIFGFLPASHAAAGWQINDAALALEAAHGLQYASDTRIGGVAGGGGADPQAADPFFPQLGAAPSACPQYPTTLPTFDELIGVDGVDERTVGAAVYQHSLAVPPSGLHVFTLHAELEGMLLIDAFEDLLLHWRKAGASVTRMAKIHALAAGRSWPTRAVVMGEIPGRSGRLAVSTAVSADAPPPNPVSAVSA
jgi:peptidoglycan/xylan/chitin deacetylase (PgdA/CDA1 family)